MVSHKLTCSPLRGAVPINRALWVIESPIPTSSAPVDHILLQQLVIPSPLVPIREPVDFEARSGVRPPAALTPLGGKGCTRGSGWLWSRFGARAAVLHVI